MEAFQGLNSDNYTNDADSRLQSYPYFQISAFQKQNPTKTYNEANQSDCNQHAYPSHDLTYQNFFDKEGAFDFDKEKELMTSSQKHQITTDPHLSFLGHNISTSFLKEDEQLNSQLSHQRSEGHSLSELAPLFGSKQLIRALNPRHNNKTLHNNHEYQLQNNHIQCLDSNNRVNLSPFPEKTSQFITPKKILDSHNHQSKNYSMTEVKNIASSKKASLENLEDIKRKILPIHFFSNKSSKSKIIDYQSQQKTRPSQISGKASKFSSIKNQKLFDDKKATENIAMYDSNRRVNKIKTKKKNLNKTQPILTQDEQILANITSSFRTTLSFESYEIKHLNSLKEFNKRLEQQRKLSLSLLRNQEQNPENLLSKRDQVGHQNYNKSFQEDHHMSSDDAGLKAMPRLENQFSFSGKFTNSDKKNDLMHGQNLVGSSRNVTFQEEQSIMNSEIKTFNQVQEQTRVKCNCQKNNCRQGYCDCLKNKMACDPSICSCKDCENDLSNHDILRIQIQGKQQKQNSGREGGCKCKNSNCKKNYCECHQNKKFCDPLKCKCKDCENLNQ